MKELKHFFYLLAALVCICVAVNYLFGEGKKSEEKESSPVYRKEVLIEKEPVTKNVPVIDTISLMQSTCLQIAELSRLIIYEDYKSYTKDAPKTIENLDLLIKHTKNKKNIDLFKSCKKTIENNPTGDEMYHVVEKLVDVWKIYKRNEKKEFYKNK